MRFDLDSDTRRKVGQRLIELVDQYYSSLPNRPVQLPAEKRTYGTLNDPLPENGADPLVVLEEVFGEMVAKGFHVPSANYFGLMNPTPTYMGFIAEAMVSALNPQLATLARSQLASKIELETVRWIAERVGWNSEFGGTFTSGGNEANFSGMALALAHHFPSAMEDGIASFARQIGWAARHRAQGSAARTCDRQLATRSSEVGADDSAGPHGRASSLLRSGYGRHDEFGNCGRPGRNRRSLPAKPSVDAC